MKEERKKRKRKKEREEGREGGRNKERKRGKGKSPNCLPKWLYHFTFPPSMSESSCSSTLLAFDFVRGPYLGHFNSYVMVSHYYFCFPFSDDVSCGISFPVLIFHLYIFLAVVFILSLIHI